MASMLVFGLVLITHGPAHAADLDCFDFGTREAANKELSRTMSEFGRDVHRLDADGDGNACERNGSAIVWSGIAAVAGVLAGFSLARNQPDSSHDWSIAIGHAIAAAFAGLFLGWLLPGILPRTWTVAAYSIGLAGIAALIEYTIIQNRRQPS